LRERTLALLARREHSRLELSRKLERAGFACDAIASLLDEFEEKNWLSDQRFAEAWIADHRAKSGAIKLAYELRQRGVAEAIIDAVLADPPDSELDRARAVWLKKFGSAPATPADYAKQMRFLLSRGFSAEVLRALLRPRDE
jgi:regulatory protein